MFLINYILKINNSRRILTPAAKIANFVCFFILTMLVMAIDIVEGAVVRDLSVLSQNPLSYLAQNGADQPMLPQADLERLNKESDALFFAPWHRETPKHSFDHAAWGLKKYADNPGYGNNGQPHKKVWIKKIAQNAHIEDYPQRIFPAIALDNINFRLLPTEERHSNYPDYPGKSNTFDNLQQSSAPSGTPLLVTLASRDEKWFLVETSHLIGWVQAADIARVEPDFVKSWENGRYAVIVRDKTPLSIGSEIICKVPLGSVFPKTGEDADSIHIWTAKRDSQGKAALTKASVPKGSAAMKPLPFTPGNVARLAGELAGGKYGWGDMGGKRDCSSTVRDIFLPFGILLPRNSVDQAGAGRFVSFLGLSNEKKENLIVQKGVPWRTLLWTPGHVMLYIGIYQGKPLIFHNFWKIATLGADGQKGRIVVGRTAITTLYPGRELPNIDRSQADILSGLTGMALIGEQNQNWLKAKLNVHKAKLNVHKAKLNVHKAQLNVHKAKPNVHKAKLNVHKAQLNVHKAQLDVHNMPPGPLFSAEAIHREP